MDSTHQETAQAHPYDLAGLDPIGYLTVADNDLILEANAAAARLLGIHPVSLVNQPLSRFLFPDDQPLPSPEETDRQSAGDGTWYQQCELRLVRPDGTVFWGRLSMTRRFRFDGLVVCRIALRDISEKKQAEAVIAARMRLLKSADDLSLTMLLQATLDEAELLTGSTIGFCHFLEPDQATLSLQAWSSNTLAHMCQAEGAGRHYPVSHAGVWVDCLHERRPVIHNDYESLPHRKGLPPGHAPVVRELVVPVMRGNVIVAILGVGNKETPYTAQDVGTVATLADLAWDITERKRAEEALRESEERHRLLFEAATDALFLLDSESLQVVEVNNRATDLYGYSRDELHALNYLQVTAEPDVSRRRIEEILAGTTRLFEVPLCWHRKKDGSTFPVEITARTLPLNFRQAVLLAVRDISKRKAAEEALRESEERRRLEQEAANVQLREQTENLTSIYKALDSVGLIVCDLVDNDARIAIFNTGAENLFGWREEEVIGRSIALIYPTEFGGLIPDGVERFKQGRSMQSFDMILTRQSGERFPAVVSVHPFDCRDDRYCKVIAVFRDISEIKRIQIELEIINDELERRVEQRTRELQETQKQYLHAEKLSAIGKLSASIAHEFNNPLQGILSILKGLKKRAILEEEDRSLLEAAIGECDRIKELIRSLQDFNRPTSGRAVLMDVHKALDAMLLLQKNDFKNKRIAVERDYGDRLPQIMAVPDQIKQVLLNLLNNAADACRQPGGLITVTTRQEEDRVTVAIRDNGIGIKPEEMELIFQPFYTTKQAVKGTGLGLSVSYGIVKNHGGEIRVVSQPGQGATFTLVLPIKGRPETDGDIRMSAAATPLLCGRTKADPEEGQWSDTPRR